MSPISNGRNYSSTSSRWVCSGRKRRIFQFPKESRHKLLSERISHAIFIRISIFPFSEEETTAAPVPGEYVLARNGGYFNSQRKVVTNYYQNESATQYSFESLFSHFQKKKLPQHQFQVSMFWPETEDISIPKEKSSQTTIRTNQPRNIHSYLYFPFLVEETTTAPVVGEYFLARNEGHFNSQRKPRKVG